MKTWMRLGLLAVLAVATIVLFSCAPKPVSITDRISDFVSSLNGDRSDTYTNLDPSIIVYSLGKPSAYWDTFFPQSYKQYSFAPNSPDTSNSSAVVVTIQGSSGPPYPCSFAMENIGTLSDNWVIHGLVIGGVLTVIY